MIKIDKDKLEHFFYGSLVAFAITMILKLLLCDYQLWLVVIGVVIGFGFEIYQKVFGKGIYETLDAIYTIVPFVLLAVTHIKL